MGRATLYSGLLHLGVILALVVGLPSFVSDLEAPPPIPVELVELSEEDTPPPKPDPKPVEAKPEPKPEPKPTPEPEPQKAKLPEPAPAPEPAPEPEPEEVVVPPEPEEAPAPEPEPEVAETEAPPPTPPSKPKIKAAVVDKPKKEEKKEDRLTSILRNVDKLRKEQTAAVEPAEVKNPEAPPKPQSSRIEQATLARMIASQMSRCWRIDPGARAAEDLIIVIEVTLDRGGEVLKVDFAEKNRVSSDDFYRSAAENARRAILECAPFELPAKRYEVWREMTLRFDPARMFGG